MDLNKFIHPEDAAALKALNAIPLLPSIVKKVMDVSTEQMYFGLNRASKIKLSPTQLPELYGILPPICEKLGIQEPEFYLEMDPNPNAYAFGDTKTAVTINSAIVQLLDKEELTAVIAHECAHIACHHMLYHSLAAILANAAGSFDLLKDLATPISFALFYWERKSELTCDRVAAAFTSPQVVSRLMLRLAGGPLAITKNVNIEEWVQQAEAYEDVRTDGIWNRTLQTFAVLNQDHPYAAVRVREILKWEESGEFAAALNEPKTCPSCNCVVDPSWTFCQNCGAKLK